MYSVPTQRMGRDHVKVGISQFFALTFDEDKHVVFDLRYNRPHNTSPGRGGLAGKPTYLGLVLFFHV